MNESQSLSFDLMIESVYKLGDAKLVVVLYNQDCFHELLGWRQLMIDTLYHYKDLNEVPPQVSEAKEEAESLVPPRSNIL